MSSVLKFACEFVFDKPSLDFGDWEYNYERVISEAYWLYASDLVDFNTDIWEFFTEHQDVIDLEIGFSYHVFIVGTITIETSKDWETGIEDVDFISAEFEDVKIQQMPASDAHKTLILN